MTRLSIEAKRHCQEQLDNIEQDGNEAETEIRTWFERDRAHVCLCLKDTDYTVCEGWDTAVSEAIEDGFLNPKDWHQSALTYAIERDLLKEALKRQLSDSIVAIYGDD